MRIHSRLIFLVVAIVSASLLPAQVPMDKEAFTRFVLKKLEEKNPDRRFTYVAPLAIKHSVDNEGTWGDLYFDHLLELVSATPQQADEIVNRYVNASTGYMKDYEAGAEAESARMKDHILPLPEIGAGDPKLLIEMEAPGSEKFLNIYTFTDKTMPREETLMGIGAGDKIRPFLKLLYPRTGSPRYDAELSHCYPFGSGKGFVRIDKFGPVVAGKTLENIDYVVFEKTRSEVVATVVSGEAANQKYGIQKSCQFLGMLDERLFYWSPQVPTNVYARNLTNGKLYRWTLPRVYAIEGVLRGISKDYGFVVYRRAFPSGERTLMEVAAKDGVVEP